MQKCRMPLHDKVIPQQTLEILKIREYSKETFTMDSIFGVVIGGELKFELLNRNSTKDIFL